MKRKGFILSILAVIGLSCSQKANNNSDTEDVKDNQTQKDTTIVKDSILHEGDQEVLDSALSLVYPSFLYDTSSITYYHPYLDFILSSDKPSNEFIAGGVAYDQGMK